MDFDFTYPTQQVLVFKTNINTQNDLIALAPALNRDERIQNWSLALDDCDKVLRVVSETLCEEEIILLVKNAGYACEDLED